MVEAFVSFGGLLDDDNTELDAVLRQTEMHNPWFTQFHMRLSLRVFKENFFNQDKLSLWLEKYDPAVSTRSIGLILAGNIPFVGMHDILCVLFSGHRAVIKLSSKDMYFFPWMYKKLCEISSAFEGLITFADRLKNFDAVIATGSNNSARYFEYYFGKYPHIIRKNRTSIAILDGSETDAELSELGKDVFYYYGLGCRNVTKLFIPEGFDVKKLFPIWEEYRYVAENNKYKNNYDYNRSILLLNQTPHFANDFFMLKEDDKLFSPLTIINYQVYNTDADLEYTLEPIMDQLQCIVSKKPGNTPAGQTQFPGLADYADHTDTMQWLQNL